MPSTTAAKSTSTRSARRSMTPARPGVPPSAAIFCNRGTLSWRLYPPIASITTNTRIFASRIWPYSVWSRLSRLPHVDERLHDPRQEHDRDADAGDRREAQEDACEQAPPADEVERPHRAAEHEDQHREAADPDADRDDVQRRAGEKHRRRILRVRMSGERGRHRQEREQDEHHDEVPRAPEAPRQRKTGARERRGLHHRHRPCAGTRAGNVPPKASQTSTRAPHIEPKCVSTTWRTTVQPIASSSDPPDAV